MFSPWSNFRWAMFTDTMKFWPLSYTRNWRADPQARSSRCRSTAIGSSAPETSRLVFTDRIENVPEEYRKVGTSILMENDKGQTRSFLVTRVDDKTLTVDGNNPLCGREVVFTLEIVTVREPTDEEARAGGAIGAQAAIDPSLMRPV